MSDRTVVKKVKNATLFSDGTIMLSLVRASYPHVDKKWCKNPAKDTPAYSLVGILPTETHQEAIDLCLEVANDLIAAENKGKPVADDKIFIRDGKPTKKVEYAGAWTVHAREADNRPVVLNPDKSEMDQDEIKSTIKPGHRVDMLVDPWFQDNEHGKRVNSSLRAVRYRYEDEEIGEGGLDKDDAISSFDDDEDGGFGDDQPDDDNGGL